MKTSERGLSSCVTSARRHECQIGRLGCLWLGLTSDSAALPFRRAKGRRAAGSGEVQGAACGVYAVVTAALYGQCTTAAPALQPYATLLPRQRTQDCGVHLHAGVRTC